MGDGLGAGALPTSLGHLAVLELEQGLDREHGAEQGLGPADPPALLEVLERVERADHADAIEVLVDDRHDLGDRRPGGGGLGGHDGQEALGHGHRTGVDHDHVEVLDRLSRRQGGLVRAGELA